MKQVILNIIKKNKTIHHFFQNSNFINGLYQYITLSSSIIKKEWKFYPFFLRNTFVCYIFRNKKDISFTFKGNHIIMPNHLKGMDGFIEVWTDEYYDKIQGANHVLDLGGYIGDSGLKLAENNKKVTIYEAHPENFQYLKGNTTSHTNISAYNYAVIGESQEKSIRFYGGGFNMASETGNISIKDDYINVPTKNIIDILHEHNFDALKMDIEGAEYDCFEALMNYDQEIFHFKNGFIEFHLGDKFEKNINKVHNIIQWLKLRGYSIELFDVILGKHVTELDQIESCVFLVYFNKKG